MRHIPPHLIRWLLACVGSAALHGPLAAQAALPTSAQRAPAPSARGDVGAALLAADAAWSARVAKRPSGVGVSEMLTTDALLLLPDREIARGAEVRRVLRAEASAAWRQRSTPVRAEASADGSRGYTFGFYDMRSTDSVMARGKYLAWWRRETDGTWRVQAYLRVPHPPGAPDLTVPRGFARVRTGGARAQRPRAELLDEVQAADRAFAKRGESGLGRAFAEAATEDAAMLGGGLGFVWGPRAIADLFSGFPPSVRLTWTPTDADVAASGDLAMTIGTGQLFDVAVPREPPSARRYLTIWRRGADGRWRFVHDGGTTGPQGAPPAGR